eukprot:2531054-Prymnesium_polylepis.1
MAFLSLHSQASSAPTWHSHFGPPQPRAGGESPELAGLNYLDMFARIAEVASEYGILVMMACHRLNPKAWPGGGKWYDRTITEEH